MWRFQKVKTVRIVFFLKKDDNNLHLLGRAICNRALTGYINSPNGGCNVAFVPFPFLFSFRMGGNDITKDHQKVLVGTFNLWLTGWRPYTAWLVDISSAANGRL